MTLPVQNSCGLVMLDRPLRAPALSVCMPSLSYPASSFLVCLSKIEGSGIHEHLIVSLQLKIHAGLRPIRASLTL